MGKYGEWRPAGWADPTGPAKLSTIPNPPRRPRTKALWARVLCLLDLHDWTCKAADGIMPSEQEIALAHSESYADQMAGFESYARGYCRHCGKKMQTFKAIRP